MFRWAIAILLVGCSVEPKELNRAGGGPGDPAGGDVADEGGGEGEAGGPVGVDDPVPDPTPGEGEGEPAEDPPDPPPGEGEGEPAPVDAGEGEGEPPPPDPDPDPNPGEGEGEPVEPAPGEGEGEPPPPAPGEGEGEPPDEPDPPQPICDAGVARCVGDSVERCAEDGLAWLLDELCDLGCRRGECLEPVCEAGARRCAGDEIEECSDDLLGWRFRRDCPDGCEEGACVDRAPDQICRPGARRCDGDAAERCDDDGQRWSVVERCDGPCVDGACPCDPDSPEIPGNDIDDDCDGEVDEPVSLSVRGMRIVEDGWGADGEPPVSYGGVGNRLADAGERVVFHLTLRNTTGLRLLGGDATILSDTEGVSVVRGEAVADYPAMQEGDEAELEVTYAIDVDPDLPDGAVASFEVRYFDSLLGPLGASRFSTTVRDVTLTLEDIRVDDDGIGFSEGDDDGLADPGEAVELKMAIRTTAGLPLHAVHGDANGLSVASARAHVGITAEDPPGWIALRGPEFDQTWDEADPLSTLAPPAVFFLETAEEAPEGALSCVTVRTFLGEEDGPALYRFEREVCFRISQECPAQDGDGDLVSCQAGDCDDGDADLVAVDDEVACDGHDEDCDGTVDENWEIGAACDPPGECGPGLIECNEAGDGAVCSTGPGGSASEVEQEVCDNVDNDCDGERDEDDGEGGQCVADCPGAVVNGYCWIKAAQPNESHQNACARVGLRQTPNSVDMAWNEGALNQVAAGIGCRSIGDFGCCARGMWVFANNDCGTHNFGPSYQNFGPFSGHFPVYTCHLD